KEGAGIVVRDGGTAGDTGEVVAAGAGNDVTEPRIGIRLEPAVMDGERAGAAIGECRRDPLDCDVGAGPLVLPRRNEEPLTGAVDTLGEGLPHLRAIGDVAGETRQLGLLPSGDLEAGNDGRCGLAGHVLPFRLSTSCSRCEVGERASPLRNHHEVADVRCYLEPGGWQLGLPPPSMRGCSDRIIGTELEQYLRSHAIAVE